MTGGITTALFPGKSDEHYTPKEVFDALGCVFDLDVASPEDLTHSSVPARTQFTKTDDGLRQRWDGFVWMNPPFGGRNGVVPWLDKFFKHGNGICLVSSQTSCGWFQEYAPKAGAVFFPRTKTKFVQPDGSVAKHPPMGSCLLGVGEKGVSALIRASEVGYGTVMFPHKLGGFGL